ncbi:hypothetical protein ACP70R_008508 [Stipagrostis hirtigluma subsp. patula]
MGLKEIWQQRGEWEIRVLVLFSLTLQTILLFAGGLRKRKSDWWLRLLLWLAYLLADYTAIYALGHLSQKQKLPDGNGEELHLIVFWAPFLILHLGGQDTVTAFAVEDNELWLRHFLSLLSQVFLAGYVYRKSHPGIRLMRPAIIMFVAGVIKYGERTLALRAASMGSLRSSMLTPPDPGPNYAKFVEEWESRNAAGLDAKIVTVPERPPDDDALHVEVKEYRDLVYNAHRFYQVFRRLFVDLILSFQDRIDSLAFFGKLEMEKAFKVVEIELVLMYESLHTKALVIHSWVGRGLRLCTLAAPAVSLVLFMDAAGDTTTSYKQKRVDIIISYVLLVGAIFLELYGILLIIISPWTYADLRAIRCLRRASDVVFLLINWFYPEERVRWSNKMSQYNLISYCLKDKPRWYKTLMEQLEWKLNFGIKTLWDTWQYVEGVTVSEQLKRLIFEQIKSKASCTKDPRNYRKLGEHRGQWALQRKGLYHELGWSVDCEFDESILLWHIATDLCFHHQYPAETDGKCCSCSCNCLSKCFGCFCCTGLGPDDVKNNGALAMLSREISNYMLFLLVMRPFMMTASIGQIRFRDTCAEAKNFFRRDTEVKDVKAYLLLLVKGPSRMTEAIRQFLSDGMCAATKNFFRREVKTKDDKASAKELMEVNTKIAEPRDVKGDRSKSVLFQACKLARQLLELEGMTEDKRWRLIASVWAEMLCYAAGKCSGNAHARQLSQGGELLTVVWLLMAHFGVGDQYRVESGHARAKLIVYD